MYRKFLLFIVLFGLLVQTAFFQTMDEGNVVEDAAELESQAIELLRETSAMAVQLNSSDNRIAFTIKTADILWEHDQPEAERLFQLTMEDTRRYIAQVNADLDQIEMMAESNWANAQSASKVRVNMGKAFTMVSNLVNTLAKHDPEMAYQFLQQTKQIISNPELKKRAERSYKNLENSVVRKIAANDPAKSLELAREKLADGVSSEMVGLLNTIYRKDAEKGAAFGKEVLEKIKGTDDSKISTWILLSLLRQGSASLDAIRNSKSINSPIFSEAALRELAEMIAAKFANSSTGRGNRRIAANNISLIEKYAPQQAAQIKRTLEQRTAQTNVTRPVVPTVNQNKSNFNSVMQKMSKAKSEYQRGIRQSIEGLTAENITPEQKREIIQDVRGKILSVNNNEFRFSNLIWLATISKSVDEMEYAQVLLDQAGGFINRQPRDKKDFSKTKILANAYAGVSPDKSFEILEDMIYRLNGVVESYIKFSEYNNSGRILDNGELLMQSYSRQFTGYFSFSPITYKHLAEADFDRTRNLADKFARPELRVETRLQIAGSLLKASKQINKEDDQKGN